MGQHNDLIDVLVHGNELIEAIFVELEVGSHDATQRGNLADHAIAEWVRHSVAEEQYVYPAVREHLEHGDDIADHEINRNAHIEAVLKDLESLDASDPVFGSKLREMMRDVRGKVQEEERTLLRRMRATCSQRELDELGANVLSVKKTAPTRPHPSHPDRPPVNHVLDPGVGFIDKIRDKLTSRAV